MISVDWAIAALLEKEATVESVAKTVGTLEGKKSVGFDVSPSDPHIGEITIGTKGSDAKSAVPDYVDFHVKAQQKLPLNTLAETCKEWKSVPNTPKGTPYLYGCQAKASNDKVSVNVIVTLSGEIHEPASGITRILLQRGAW